MKTRKTKMQEAVLTEGYSVKMEGHSKNETVDIYDLVSLTQGKPHYEGGAVIGTFIGFSASCEPLVDYLENEGKAVAARTVVTLGAKETGRSVVLMFDRGDTGKPIIMGVIHESEDPSLMPGRKMPLLTGECPAQIEGERLVLNARNEIAIQCGQSSITLHKDGEVVIRGVKVVSRASRENKIKGASVLIN